MQRLGGVFVLLALGLACAGLADPPVPDGTDDPPTEVAPPGEPPEVDAWPAGIELGEATLYVAQVGRPGMALPEDFAGGLLVEDDAWEDVPVGAKLNFATATGAVGGATFTGMQELPYGCDGIERRFAVFASDLPVDGIEGEVVWMVPPGTPLSSLPQVRLAWGAQGYSASVGRQVDVQVSRTGEQTGQLTLLEKRAPTGLLTVHPFEKVSMAGVEPEDEALDLSQTDGDVAVPVLLGALQSDDTVVLTFRVYSWEGLTYAVWASRPDEEPELAGEVYHYLCAF